MPRDDNKPKLTKFQYYQLIAIMILFPSVAMFTYINWFMMIDHGKTELEMMKTTIMALAIDLYRDCLQDVKFNQYIGMQSVDVDYYYELCMSSLDDETRNYLENPFKDSVETNGVDDKV